MRPFFRLRLGAVAAACLAALGLAVAPSAAQTTTVSAAYVGGQVSPSANFTVYLQPVAGCTAGSGIGAARQGSTGGQIQGIPYTATGTTGAFTKAIPDALASSPNIAYSITAIDNVTGNTIFGAGMASDNIHVNTGGPYGCVQPTGSTWNLDTFVPGSSGVVGTPLLNWMGAWSSSTSYPTGAAVSYNGSSFANSLAGNTNNPGSATSPGTGWAVVAAQGASGVGTDPSCHTDGSGNLSCSTTAVGTSIVLKDGTRPVDASFFGAKCDGRTDDTSAIANAILAGALYGSVKSGVRFPVGTCLTDPINLANYAGNGLILSGQGPYTRTILKSWTGLPVFDLSGASSAFSQLSIRDMDITGTSAGNACFYVEPSVNGYYQLEIHNVQFDCGGSAILDKSSNPFNSTLDHVIVRNAGANAIDLAGGNSMSLDHVMIQNINCNNCAGIRVHSGTVHIDNATGMFNTISAKATAAATTTNQITLSSVTNPYTAAVVNYGHGETLEGAGIPAGTTITSQISGTPNGAGVYQLSNTVNVAAGTSVTEYFAGIWWGVFGDNVAEDGSANYVRVMLDNSDVESFGQGGGAGTGGVRAKLGSVIQCNTTEFLSQPDAINTVAWQMDGATPTIGDSTSMACHFGGSGAYKNGYPIHNLTGYYPPFFALGGFGSLSPTFWSDSFAKAYAIPQLSVQGSSGLLITNSFINSSTVAASTFGGTYVPLTVANSPYALHGSLSGTTTPGVTFGVDASGGNVAINLDSPASYPYGTIFILKKLDSSTHLAYFSASVNFDGIAGGCGLTSQYQFVAITNDPTNNWKVIGGQCNSSGTYPLPSAPSATSQLMVANAAGTSWVAAALSGVCTLSASTPGQLICPGLTQTIAAGTATMSTAAIAAGAYSAAATISTTRGTIANVLATDAPSCPANAVPSATNAPLKVVCVATAGGVTAEYYNGTAASITPTAETVNWLVTR